MKLKLFTIIFLLLVIPLVISKPVDFDKAYVWLYGQQQTDVTQAALTAISISKIDPVKAQISIDYLKNNKNSNQPCWPTNCDPSSTAFVLLALNNGITIEGVTAEDVKNWLELNQLIAPLPGNWYLQIVTSGTGSCSLTYAKKGSTLASAQIPLTVDKGKLSSPSCSSGSTFLDIRQCISPDIFSKASTQMRIDCSTLTDAKISVIYKENSAYYLVSESYSLTADITLNNGYFGTTDSTYYANWALKLSNSNVDSLLYLKKTANVNSVKDMALLSLITNNAYYQTRLSNLKSQIGGYFGQTPNLWENALAAIALGQADTSLQEWFGSQQNANGYWQDKKTTALILYALGGTATLPECITGQSKPCSDLGVCKDTLQTCDQDGKWPGCSTSNIQGYSATDICGNALDDNCDGSVDEGCDCDPTATPSEQCGSNVGICRYGTRICDIATKKWSACIGGITSSREAVNIGNTCFDNLDNDCDSLINCNDLDCQVGNDWDKDGILNDQDQEKCTPYACRSDVIREGRSEFIGKAKDQDSDGFCDSLDQCDNTALGCPVNDIDSNDRVGCPNDCSIAACREGPDNACRFTSCERDCGSGGIFDSCDRQECSILSSSLNGCIFKESLLPWLYNSCLSCSTSTRCSTYPDETECSTDPCKLGCEFKDDACVEKPKTTVFEDKDEDGFGNPRVSRNTALVLEGYVSDNTDCNDNEISINPSATEICGNNQDDNCDTEIDEDCSCAPAATETCPLPQSNTQCTKTCSAQGQWLDCDTSRAVREDTQAVCIDDLDNDCDGLIDCLDPDCGGKDCNSNGRCSNFDTDDDSDGFLDTDGTDQELCTPQDCLPLVVFGKALDNDNDGICDQKDQCRNTAPGCSPVETTGSRIGCPSIALCDQSTTCMNNDPSCLCPTCSSCSDNFFCSYDECSACATSCYYTSGFLTGTCNECSSSTRCSTYSDETDCSSDSCSKGPCLWVQSSDTCCEDKNSNNICDTQDQPTRYYKDHDTDAVGLSTDSRNLIVPEGEYTALTSGDCNDNNILINPSATEICGNNQDDNCDNEIDEDCSCTPAATETCPLPQSNAQCEKTCSAQGQWSDCDTSRKGVEDTQSLCSNSRDDDCDGFIDCLDPDCGGKDCNNNGRCSNFDTDDDNDGFLDANGIDQELCTPQDCLPLVVLGKALDSDNDGICDQKDQCRNTAPGCSPVETTGNRIGCPAAYLCDQSATCMNNDPSCLCPTCSSCSDNFFCSYEECSACAVSCYYTSGVFGSTIGGTCNECSSSTRCSTYSDETDCSSDSCSKGPCLWVQSSDTCCEDKNSNNICDTQDQPTRYYKDHDTDAVGLSTDSRNLIVPEGEYTALASGDCDDNNILINPSATEICGNNQDDNCDTEIDEDCSCAPAATETCPLPQSNAQCTKTCSAQGQWSDCDTSRAGEEDTQSLCSNSRDDDCDGLINCEDPDCGFDATQNTGDCDNDGTCDLFETNHDRDNDRVLDNYDQEKCTPQNCISTVNPAGVKLDSDLDGVCDAIDNCDTAPGCPVDQTGCVLDCQSNVACLEDPSCACPVCSDCGDGILAFCDYQECSKCGATVNCRYEGWISTSTTWGSCLACTPTDTCSSYENLEDCSSDPCLKGPCEWSGTSCVEVPKTNFYQDQDGDGFGNPSVLVRAVTAPAGYVANNQDCNNDNNPNIKPGAVEICDGLDNDCNSLTTETDCSCTIGSDPRSCPKQFGLCSGVKESCIEGRWSGCNYGSNYLENENTPAACIDDLDNDCDNSKNCNDPDCSAFDYDTDGTCDQSDPDKDGDSVLNGQDREEFTHLGCPVWKQSDNVISEYIGKAKDQDEDGICDQKDTQCPNTDKGCQVLGYDSASAGCPADCASCPNDLSCNCDDCGAGASFCSNEACLTLGEEGSGCFFKPRSSIFSYNYCYECTGRVTSCSSYLTQRDCEVNQCLNNENTQCTWDVTSNTCKLKQKTTYYYDSDNDGFGSQTNIQQSYTQPEGYIAQGGDCNDNNINIKPDATELCDGIDNNCQQGIDEDCSCQTGQIQSCSQGTYGICTQAQSQTCGQDGKLPGCNYASLTGYQLSETLCDGLDNDCDGTTDESCPCVQGEPKICTANQKGLCSGLKEICTAGVWPGCNYASITGYQPEETLCDGLNNDCDDYTDEDCSCTPAATETCPLPQSNAQCKKTCSAQGQWSDCDTSRKGVEDTQSLCSNSRDDDCDGFIDCLDPDCGGNFDANTGDNICDKFDSDKDGDGIPNANDKEEFTPLGCKVDTFNPNSLGKQLDSDNDKICDGLDKCEKTIPSCLVQGYTGSNPGCPADCEALTCVTDPSCECKTCAECISGTFDFCSQEECSVCGQGSCWFQPKDLAKDTCEACTTAKSCNTYLTQPDCSRNSCYTQINGLNCTWSTNSNCCIDNDKNGVCDNAECEPEWDCGQWSICSSTDTVQRRLCTDEESCGVTCPVGDTDCLAERACSACTPEWWCNDWSECTSGVQTRDCRDLKDCAHACPTADTTCLEQRSCGTCTPDWECTDWSECADGIKTRTCEDNNDCNIACSANEAECIEDQLCTIDEEPTSSCGNTKCESEAGENQATCPTDCTAPTNPCVVDGSCDPQFGEDETNCPEDCREDVTPPPPGPTAYCGDGTCDSNEDSTLCPEDCETTGTGDGTGTTPTEEPTKSRLWLYLILILLLFLLVAAYFLFFKKPSKKNKKPFGSLGSLLPQAPSRQPLFGPQSTPQPRKPTTPTREKPRKSLVEDELEKSIREAGKIIGK